MGRIDYKLVERENMRSLLASEFGWREEDFPHWEIGWSNAMDAAHADLDRLRQALAAAEAECAAARLLQPQRMTMGQAERWDRFVIRQKDNDATRERLGLGKIGEAR